MLLLQRIRVLVSAGQQPSWVLHGEHRFRFGSSEDGQATEFFQEERFTSPLSWLMDDNFLARKIGQRASLVKSYEELNADFKNWVESTHCASFV